MSKSGKATSVSATYSALPPAWFEPSLHSAYLHISAQFISAHQRPTGQPRLLPIVEFLPLLQAYDAVERPEMGLDLGLAIPATAHGSMGLTALSSDTLWDAMKTVVRYLPVRNAIFNYRCFQQGDLAICELRPRLHLGEFGKFFAYTGLVAIHNIFKTVSNDAINGWTRLTVPWGKPSWPPMSSTVATALDFDKPSLSIQVPLEMAMRPSQSADPDLCKRLKMFSEDELTKSTGSTAAKVRHLLRQKTPVWPSLQELADELATSKRTLIRKLESEELSYQLLLDEARSELANWFLRRSNMQLSEIAEQIGFSDQASFTKSFQRVQGCTPSQYRADFRRAFAPDLIETSFGKLT